MTDRSELPCIELTDEEPSAASAGKKDNSAAAKIDGIDGSSNRAPPLLIGLI
jgi:hypothetical protein